MFKLGLQTIQERARQAALEQHHLEEQRKLLEQREAARRELDRARKLEQDKQHAKQLGKDRQKTEQEVLFTVVE